jgi:hypothetical protein
LQSDMTSVYYILSNTEIPNKMHMLQSLFYLTIALRVSDITITHLQEHKTTVTKASGNRYTVIDRVNSLLLKSAYRLD